MTSLWLDDEAEADGLCGDDDIECEEDFQLEFDAAQALCQRAFDRAREKVLARRAARPSAPTAPSTQRATAAALRKLDIEAKVRQDSFRRAFAAQGRRMILSEYSAVAGAAVNQFIESFDAPESPYARAALRFSPFLLMSPQQRGFADPRLIGAAAIAGIVIIGESRTQSRQPHDIKIFAPTTTIILGDSVNFVADVVDSRNAVLPGERVAWQSSNPTVAKIDPATGAVTTTSPNTVRITTTALGTALITAAAGNVVRRIALTVKLSP
jgi:uncharacterized protein YjdB